MQIYKQLKNIFFLTVLLLLLFSVPGNSQNRTKISVQDTIIKKTYSAKQPEYTTSRISMPVPVIDGKLDDECWEKGTWAGNFHQWIPDEGAKPSYPTELNIQYDDKNIYVALRAFDREPGKIKRMSGGRDILNGDMMGIAFDSYRDYRTGFEFDLTAWGQKIDLILSNPENADYNWNAVWKGKVGTEDSAWVAEMEIPLSQLRYSRETDQVWGLHIWRWIARLQEESDWEIQSRTGPGMLYNFGELKGIKGLKRSRRLELMPFLLGDLKTYEKQPGNPFYEKGRTWRGNLGLDAKIGVSSNFTVDLTVNPDFGQVESDPSVMNISAFETFYEEKRPFFLEGLTIFDYDFDGRNIFYSRRIGHSPSLGIYPDGSSFIKSPEQTTIITAAKLSGTTSKGLSVGLIQSVTANEFAKISDLSGNISRTKIEPLTNYTVARLQKGYKAGNTVLGGILTSTNRFINNKNLDFLVRDAYTGGLDIMHHWKDKEFYLDAKLLGSFVNGSKQAITELQETSARYFQRPGADYLEYDTTRTTLSGHGGKIKIGKGSKGFWRYSTEVSWLSPGLELNDIGYMNSTDEINQQNVVSYFVNKPVSIFNTYYITLEQFNSWNFNSTYLGSGAHLSFYSQFRNNYSVNANFIFHSQGSDTRKLRGGPDMIVPSRLNISGSADSDPSKKIVFGFAWQYNHSGNNSSMSYRLEPRISIRPLSSLKITVNASYLSNKDELQYVTSRNYLSVKRYILGTIGQKTLGLTFRADLNLTPEFSIQYYGSPFISRGSYSEFKRVTNPEGKKYNERISLLKPIMIAENSYGLDENNDNIEEYSITDPDFNFHQFRSNFVAKWEYRPGSFLYLVWSSDRTGSNSSSDASFADSFSLLKNVFPENIFLIKLNYWFSF
jgi:hypothetical protein